MYHVVIVVHAYKDGTACGSDATIASRPKLTYSKRKAHTLSADHFVFSVSVYQYHFPSGFVFFQTWHFRGRAIAGKRRQQTTAERETMSPISRLVTRRPFSVMSSIRTAARSMEPHPFQRLPVTQRPAKPDWGNNMKRAAAQAAIFFPSIGLYLGWPVAAKMLLDGHV
ncbi:hypothetical protein CDD82_488 [Ophiocordyceps australis]|uniref:Uncharacterized protein n=1 Tax=Ophiocordyceps australis TaxID=1399860 RepID=A0A2C5Y0X0_9HYPO|nr:hypothetical protein CDD82_488 [Ophiocordyceps australis]